jgi:hypothetical protein
METSLIYIVRKNDRELRLNKTANERSINNMRIAKFIITLMLFISMFFSQSKASLASVSESDLIVFAHNRGDLNWQHGDNDYFGFYNRWNYFTSELLNLPMTKENHEYRPGCIPTGIGQIMCYLIKYRYADENYASTIFLPDAETSHDFVLDYINLANLRSSLDASRKNILSEIVSPDQGKYRYKWLEMPDALDSNIGSGNGNEVKSNIAPLLFDLGISMGVHYGLNILGKPATTNAYVYDGEQIVKDFGFEHAAFYGVSAVFNSLLEAPLGFRWQRTLRRIIQTNLDYDHPVLIAGTKHAFVIEGYGMPWGKYFDIYKYPRAFWDQNEDIYYSIDDLNGNNGHWYHLFSWDALLSDETVFWPTRVLFNVFPRIPDEIKLLDRTPEIISGRVVPSSLHTHELEFGYAFLNQIYVQPTVLSLTQTNNDENMNLKLNLVSVDMKTGVYAAAVPNDSVIKLEVVDDQGEPYGTYPEITKRPKTSNHDLGFIYTLGNQWGVDFYPSNTTITTSSLENTSQTLEDAEHNYSEMTKQELDTFPNSSLSNTATNELLVVASDTQYDVSGSGNYTNAVLNALEFVNSGGTLLATGKSSAFPRTLGGSASPTFYSFTNSYQPYGSGTEKTVAIHSPRIIERLGGVTSVILNSSLPQSQHSIIENPRNNLVLASTTYAIQEIVIPPLGYPYIDYHAITAPVLIEYDRGSNGGKVIYSSLELSPNYNAGGLPKAFVNAVFEPLLFKEDDEFNVLDTIGGEFYEGPSVISSSIKNQNLNMVVASGGITIDSSESDNDISFLFIISDRRAVSPAPQIDASGDPDAGRDRNRRRVARHN